MMTMMSMNQGRLMVRTGGSCCCEPSRRCSICLGIDNYDDGDWCHWNIMTFMMMMEECEDPKMFLYKGDDNKIMNIVPKT